MHAHNPRGARIIKRDPRHTTWRREAGLWGAWLTGLKIAGASEIRTTRYTLFLCAKKFTSAGCAPNPLLSFKSSSCNAGRPPSHIFAALPCILCDVLYQGLHALRTPRISPWDFGF